MAPRTPREYLGLQLGHKPLFREYDGSVALQTAVRVMSLLEALIQ